MVTDTKTAPAPTMAAWPADDQTRQSPLLLRPLRQAADLVGGQAGHRRPRPLAPRRPGQVAAAKPRSTTRASSSACRPTTASASCPPPTPARSRWRCGRSSARARPPCSPGKASARAGSPTRSSSCKLDAEVMTADYGRIVDLAAVDWDTDVVFTWNGTTSGVRVPNGDAIPAGRAGPDDLRRHLRRLRPGPAVGQARCHHLLLAEGDGRRGGARDADPLAPRGRAAGELHARLAAAEDLPPHQGRQADRGHLQRRDDQHALDALRRGLPLRARLGPLGRRARRA